MQEAGGDGQRALPGEVARRRAALPLIPSGLPPSADGLHACAHGNEPLRGASLRRWCSHFVLITMADYPQEVRQDACRSTALSRQLWQPGRRAGPLQRHAARGAGGAGQGVREAERRRAGRGDARCPDAAAPPKARKDRGEGRRGAAGREAARGGRLRGARPGRGRAAPSANVRCLLAGHRRTWPPDTGQRSLSSHHRPTTWCRQGGHRPRAGARDDGRDDGRDHVPMSGAFPPRRPDEEEELAEIERAAMERLA